MPVKVVELLGQSTKGWQEAVEAAVVQASRELGQVTGVEVYNLTGNVKDGRIVEYKADVKIAYVES
ncbi:MAG: dodecin domain-containing protein [Clostridia bacterium]|nr:dodecin domain-containing protein [Clostridia bacterium]